MIQQLVDFFKQATACMIPVLELIVREITSSALSGSWFVLVIWIPRVVVLCFDLSVLAKPFSELC